MTLEDGIRTAYTLMVLLNASRLSCVMAFWAGGGNGMVQQKGYQAVQVFESSPKFCGRIGSLALSHYPLQADLCFSLNQAPALIVSPQDEDKTQHCGARDAVQIK